jgi:hypothetical protein
MLTLLKLLHSLIKTRHSDGTPGQVAPGIVSAQRWASRR